ncbi:MAG: flagellar biosynthesis regulator FlaF [Paracoccus sp. (in: a-proteobacteria)]
MNTLNAVTPLKDHGHYGSHGVRTERDIEYEAFSQVTRMLRGTGETRPGPDQVMAIHRNNELWTILATDLAHPGNRLPAETRAGLISLAGFALRQGQSVLRGTGSVEPLIEVNVSIMKGLRGAVPE